MEDKAVEEPENPAEEAEQDEKEQALRSVLFHIKADL